MFETEKKLTKATSIAGRNTMQGSYKTIGNELLPDQTQHNLFLKELIEVRAAQNNVKNKLRKVLFNADTGK